MRVEVFLLDFLRDTLRGFELLRGVVEDGGTVLCDGAVSRGLGCEGELE